MLESQSRSPKKAQEVYVPPGRRSGNGAPNANKGIPLKARQSPEKVDGKVKRDEDLPNCCEDLEEGELEATPPKNSPTELRRRSNNVTNPTKLFQQTIKVTHKNITTRKSLQTDVEMETIQDKIEQSTIKSQNFNAAANNRFAQLRPDYRREPTKRSEECTELEKYQINEVPYIDSHCHTDFIFSHLRNNGFSGLVNWIERYRQGFPKSFAGLIANFVQPSLFVFTKESKHSYDLEWVARELQSSDLYLGTTWGCHPHYGQKWGRVSDFWDTLEAILIDKAKWKVLAVGECGIDLHRCDTDLELQKHVFQKHVHLAFKYNLPLVIHCRNGGKGYAEDMCLEILAEQMKYNHRFLKIHRHCFTEDWETAKKWLTVCPDVHFGFTAGIFGFRERQLEAIRRIPLDRILLETDGPYFKPKVFDSVGPHKCCLPGMAIATAFKIAEIKGLPPAEVLRATYNNTRRVYQMPLF